MLVCILGSILILGLFVTNINIAHTVMNEGGGNGVLSTCWAIVKVDNVRYDPVTQRTYSCHWFELLNYLDRQLWFTYEFSHNVEEVLRRDNRGNIINARFIDLSQTFLGTSVNANDNYVQCGGQGIDMKGQRVGEYEIRAYTAVRTNIRGDLLAVETPDEVTVFRIFEND